MRELAKLSAINCLRQGGMGFMVSQVPKSEAPGAPSFSGDSHFPSPGPGPAPVSSEDPLIAKDAMNGAQPGRGIGTEETG